MKKTLLFLCAFMAGCAGFDGYDTESENQFVPTPTVDYVRHLDPYGGPHNDMFLSRLTMNYRSFAIFNADIAGRPEIGEMFAQKAVSTFSGETPMPESLDNWKIRDKNEQFDLQNACKDLIRALSEDASVEQPQLAAEAQAKFDCWLAAASSDQFGTATECRNRFENAMLAIYGGGILSDDTASDRRPMEHKPTSGFDMTEEYPTTAELDMFTDTVRTREGLVVVNHISVPSDLIRPAPVHPVQFNQNIYTNGQAGEGLGNEMVSRDEFLSMMMELRTMIQEINARVDGQPVEKQGDAVIIGISQIPTEPKQKIVEEIFEVRFDFNKASIRPEYETVIQKLAANARDNKNVKISVVGHTDTVGGPNYNFALGGRRAENVKQMLIAQGIPAHSIIALSSGKNDLKVKTGDNVKNADNRRVRVVKEVRYTEPAKKPDPVAE